MQLNMQMAVTVDADLKNISLNRILDANLEALPVSNIPQFKIIVAKMQIEFILEDFHLGNCKN